MSFAQDALPEYLCASYDINDPADVELLKQDLVLGTDRLGLFEELLRQVRDLRAVSALVETRYFDPDYRNEHARFYSSTFRRYPSIASRVLFFAEDIDDLNALIENPNVLDSMTLLGYAVIRPVPPAPIGRTMVASPRWAIGAVTCGTAEYVSLFGSRLSLVGVPFVSQDGQLGVCAHASSWITAQQHHLRNGRPRRLPSDIADAVPGGPGLGRSYPASPVSVHQLSETYSHLGLPPLVYWQQRLPPDEDLEAVLCRYLNSGMPVTVSCGHHTFVVVGYRRLPHGSTELPEWNDRADLASRRWSEVHLNAVTGTDPANTVSVPADTDAEPGTVSAHSAITTETSSAEVQTLPRSTVFFLCQDDMAGPYQVRRFGNADADGVRHADWQYFLVPLPDKVYLSGEDAEFFADEWIHERLRLNIDRSGVKPLRKLIMKGKTRIRSTLTTANDFKAQLPARGADAAVIAHYRATRMSRLVWVCELLDTDARDADLDSVIGEVIIDATSHPNAVDALAWRLPRILGYTDIDSGTHEDLTGPPTASLWPMYLPAPEQSGSAP